MLKAIGFENIGKTKTVKSTVHNTKIICKLKNLNKRQF